MTTSGNIWVLEDWNPKSKNLVIFSLRSLGNGSVATKNVQSSRANVRKDQSKSMSLSLGKGQVSVSAPKTKPKQAKAAKPAAPKAAKPKQSNSKRVKYPKKYWKSLTSEQKKIATESLSKLDPVRAREYVKSFVNQTYSDVMKFDLTSNANDPDLSSFWIPGYPK